MKRYSGFLLTEILLHLPGEAYGWCGDGLCLCARSPGGKGYARDAVEELIKLCGSESIYIHSTLDLIPFYKTLGFSTIPEDQLPPSIKERFSFCLGNMKGCNVSPMVRRRGAVVR